jgi:hypothetical protein
MESAALRTSAGGNLVERLCPKEVGENSSGICKDGTVSGLLHGEPAHLDSFIHRFAGQARVVIRPWRNPGAQYAGNFRGNIKGSDCQN